jgi:hypothetical protein
VLENKTFNKFIFPALAFVAMGIISYFLFGKLEKLDDTQRTILEEVAIIKTKIENIEEKEIEDIKKLLESMSESQGTLNANSGDNKLELSLLKLRLENIERQIN